MAENRVEVGALHGITFFAGLTDEDLQGVVDVGRRVSYGPGEVIVSKGEAGDGMYVILGGRAEVEVGGRFHRLGKGDFFGEMALITARNRMATVKAVEPVTALKIHADAFQTFLMEHPGVTLAMLKAVVGRLREVQDRIDAWMGTG